jgi:hypothetical protein
VEAVMTYFKVPSHNSFGEIEKNEEHLAQRPRTKPRASHSEKVFYGFNLASMQYNITKATNVIWKLIKENHGAEMQMLKNRLSVIKKNVQRNWEGEVVNLLIFLI